MLQKFLDDFMAFVPLRFPGLLDAETMESPLVYDDYILLTFQVSGNFTLEEVMDMLEDDMEMIILYHHIPTGALLLVSDQPMIPEGVKTEQSDTMVTQRFVHEHVEIGIDALRMIIDEKKTVKHLKFDW